MFQLMVKNPGKYSRIHKKSGTFPKSTRYLHGMKISESDTQTAMQTYN